MISWPLTQYVLRAVIRDRIIQLMVVLLLLGMSCSIFMGGTAVIEQKEFTIALAATALRVVTILGLVVFICFFVRRSFENREIDYLLATPLTRRKLLFSFSVSFMAVALLFSLMITGMLMVMTPTITQGLLTWGASVFVELSVTAMIALFFSVALKSATVSVLGTLGYYTLARMMGAMIGIMAMKYDGTVVTHTFLSWVVKILSTITPRFDLLAQSAWLVYGTTGDFILWVLPIQFIAFSALFFFGAAFDLRRSQF